MGKRKSFTGEVISDKMQKTVIVKIGTLRKHPKYGKVIKRYKKYKVHDEGKIAKVGDIVSIEETKPISKDKHFRILKIVKISGLPHVEIKEEIQ